MSGRSDDEDDVRKAKAAAETPATQPSADHARAQQHQHVTDAHAQVPGKTPLSNGSRRHARPQYRQDVLTNVPLPNSPVVPLHGPNETPQVPLTVPPELLGSSTTNPIIVANKLQAYISAAQFAAIQAARSDRKQVQALLRLVIKQITDQVNASANGAAKKALQEAAANPAIAVDKYKEAAMRLKYQGAGTVPANAVTVPQLAVAPAVAAPQYVLPSLLGFGAANTSTPPAAKSAATAAAADAKGRAPATKYMFVHGNQLAQAIASMVRESAWPTPGAQLAWRDEAQFATRVINGLCPVVRDDAEAMFRLMAPHDPADEYNRYVADAKLRTQVWSPAFGEAIAALMKQTLFASIVRIGGRFEALALAAPIIPTAKQVTTSHPLDNYVASAMAAASVLDYGDVVAAPTPAPTKAKRHAHGAQGGKAGASKASATAPVAPAVTPVSFEWQGRRDAKLWNYVKVSPASATVEEVAAALYGDPSQSRMAYAIQKHGEFFAVAPHEARALIAARFSHEVVGYGATNDGAALAKSAIGDSAALTEVHGGASAPAAAVSVAQLTQLASAIHEKLDEIKAAVTPLGLADVLAPAYAFQQRSVADLAHADAAKRAQWAPVWHAQHVHLLTIANAVRPLMQQLMPMIVLPMTRDGQYDALKELVTQYLHAAAQSHHKESCSAVLARIAAQARQQMLDAQTRSRIGVHDATRQRPNQQLGEHSSDAAAAVTADDALLRAQERLMLGDVSPAALAQAQQARLDADESALRIRMRTVAIGLQDLQMAAEAAGDGFSGLIAARFSGKFRRLPQFIDAIETRLSDVTRVWAAAQRAVPAQVVVDAEHTAAAAEMHARQVGLAAAQQAFAGIAADRDIGTFFREAQAVVSSQAFRAGMVKLAGVLVITVVTSGVAAEAGSVLAASIGEGSSLARLGGLAASMTVNITVNGALQYAMSEGHESIGWALLENALMEVATRGLMHMLKKPMERLGELQANAWANVQRLKELKQIKKSGRVLTEVEEVERSLLAGSRLEHTVWYVNQLSNELVMGMATQWAAQQLVHKFKKAPKPGEAGAAGQGDDFAMTLLQQGAAIALGKHLHGLKTAWAQRRASLAAQPSFSQLPEAHALVERRAKFFAEAGELATSISPDPAAIERLTVEHQALVALEQKVALQLGNGTAPHGGAEHADAAHGKVSTAEHQQRAKPDEHLAKAKPNEHLDKVKPAANEHLDKGQSADESKIVHKDESNGWTVEEPPKTLADDSPLLRPTDQINTAERTALRDRIVEELLAGALPVEGRKPKLFLMGGGGASGKGYVGKRLQAKHVLPDAGAVHIDPDGIKSMIPEYGKIQATGDSRAASVVHEESSALSKRVLAEAYSHRFDIVMDVTLGNTGKGLAMIQAAHVAGYEVMLIGVTTDPALAVTRAAERAKKERRYVPTEDLLKAHRGFSEGFEAYARSVDEAFLFDTTSGGPDPVLVAQKKNGQQLDVLVSNLYEQFKAKATLNPLAHGPSDLYGAKAAAPTREEYIQSAMANLRNTSRTAKGTVDLSASPDKAGSMAEGLTGQGAADLASRNVEQATGKLYDLRNQPIENPVALRRFVESIAGEINTGIVKDGALLRSHDSEKYPYTRVVELESAMVDFYSEFYRRLKDPGQDPIKLAAWVEYRIDLTDHFFSDGCGKIAKAISGWTLMRNSHQLPAFSADRSAIFKHAPTSRRGQNADLDASQLQVWEKFYRGMFDNAATPSKDATAQSRTPSEKFRELPPEDKQSIETARRETEENHE
ncbi:MAG TPA: zeta toxin family protein [Kofleriaceae bacterium]|nr:zeta toxin family protein [Kofleriaceae bacterium]